MSDSSGNAEWPDNRPTQRRDVPGGGDGTAWAGRTPPLAAGAASSGHAACTRCRAQLAAGAWFCQACGQPVAGQSPAGGGAAAPAPAGQQRTPAAGAQARQVGAGTGRGQNAGWIVLGGGAALLLSALLPWFTVLGFVGAHLPVVYFLAFGAVGAVLAFFGIRAIQGRATAAIMAALWVLTAIGALVAVGLFIAAHDVGNQSFGTVTPASGFYIGLLGLAATIVGTIALQVTRRSSASPLASQAVQLSQDGAFWWDGTAWRGVAAQAPPNAPRSPDGKWWWDGTQWRPTS